MGSDLRKNFLRPAPRAGAQLFPVGHLLPDGDQSSVGSFARSFGGFGCFASPHTHTKKALRGSAAADGWGVGSSGRAGLVFHRNVVGYGIHMYFDMLIVYSSHIT